MAAGAGTGAFFLLSGGGPGGEDPVGPFTFKVGKVTSVPVADTPPKKEVVAARDAVADLLSRLYTTAFVDTEAWENGTFPALPSYFAGPASKRAKRDLDDLSLGSEATNIERVEPSDGSLTLSFLIDPEQQPYAAVAEADFEATGRAVGGDPIAITHGGRYVVRIVDGEWRIVGYDVEGGVNSGSPQTGPSPEPGESP